jgi:hypothetical protein
MAALLNEVNASRLHRMERNARRLQERGGLRDGVGLEHARDVMWAYTAPELYELLVLLQGWSPQRFGRFVAEGLAAGLLPVDSA